MNGLGDVYAANSVLVDRIGTVFRRFRQNQFYLFQV